MSGWKSLPLRVQLYISVVVLVSLPILWHSLKTVAAAPVDSRWLILTLYTLTTVPVSVLSTNVRSGITIGDAFVMSICMMCGTDTAIVANTLYISFLTLLLKQRYNTSTHRIIFNVATAILNVYLYGIVFNLVRSLHTADKVLLPTIALAAAYFASNSFLIATAIALSTGNKFFAVWRQNYAPLALDFVVSGSAAIFIVFFVPLLFRPESKVGPLVGPLLLGPFILAIWRINKVNRAKAEEAATHLREQEQLYLRTVETLALAVDAKDQTTYGHIRRVRAYALGLANFYGVTDTNELRAIETGSLLHDIGKLAIEDYILNKPGRLNKQEYEKMKVHSTAGDEILQQVQFPFPVAQNVRFHHERWDGTGYPDGLKGNQIPLGARILSIADAFDAIRSTRPYKSAFGIEDSIELLRAQAGISYDPALVEIFVKNIERLEAEADEAARSFSELSFRKYFEKIESDRPETASESEHPLPPTPSEELVRLYEFCSGVARSLSTDDAYSVLSRRILKIIPHSTSSFYLCQNDDSVSAEHVSGLHSEFLKGTRIGLGKGISGWVAAYRRPIVSTPPELEFQGISGDFRSLKDVLSAPLIHEGECLGAITLYAQQPNFFTAEHLSLLQSIAEQVSALVRDTLTTQNAEEKGLIDQLTGTYRFAYLSVAGAQLLAQAKKSESPLSLVYMQLRNFLQNVALYGSGSGDQIMRAVADVLRSELRQTDVLVRYGHHGFVALLPGLRNLQAIRYVQRLQHQIKATPVTLAPGNQSFISCLVGIASYPNDATSLLALLQAAQLALTENEKLANSQSASTEGNVFEFPPRI